MRSVKALAAVALAVLAAALAWDAWSQRRGAERDAHLEGRPWLVFWNATEMSGSPGGPDTVVVRIRNTGNTPALDTDHAACSFFGPSRPAPGTTCRPPARPRRATVGPGGELSIAIEGAAIPDRARFASGAETVWILASVDYGDVFGHRHRGEFCQRWAADGRAWVSCDRASPSAPPSRPS